MPQRIFPHILFGMRNAVFPRQLGEQRRQDPLSPDAGGKNPGKLVKQRIHVWTRARQLHIVAVCEKIEDPFFSISFNSDRNLLICRGALRRIDPERVLRLVHLIDVGGQLGRAALEILMQESLEIVE